MTSLRPQNSVYCRIRPATFGYYWSLLLLDHLHGNISAYINIFLHPSFTRRVCSRGGGKRSLLSRLLNTCFCSSLVIGRINLASRAQTVDTTSRPLPRYALHEAYQSTPTNLFLHNSIYWLEHTCPVGVDFRCRKNKAQSTRWKDKNSLVLL